MVTSVSVSPHRKEKKGTIPGKLYRIVVWMSPNENSNWRKDAFSVLEGMAHIRPQGRLELCVDSGMRTRSLRISPPWQHLTLLLRLSQTCLSSTCHQEPYLRLEFSLYNQDPPLILFLLKICPLARARGISATPGESHVESGRIHLPRSQYPR